MITDVLDALDSSNVWQFLARRGNRAQIVAPTNVLQRILKLNGAPQFSYSTELDAVSLERGNLFVWDLDPSELDRAKQLYPSLHVSGVLRDLWVAAITGFATPGPSANQPVYYAVLCSPRSGSTFLCDLLSAAGVGAPREHIGPAFFQLFRSGYKFQKLMHWMVERGTRSGFFGTKLISHHIFENHEARFGALERFMRARGFRIISLFRDPAEQAVSGYFAHQTGVWHLNADNALGGLHDNVAYDFDWLHRQYKALCRAHADLAAFAGRFSGVLELDYKHLDQDPRGTLTRVLEYLEAPKDAALRVDMTRMRQKISNDNSRMQEVLAQFRSDLNRLPAATVAAPAGTRRTQATGLAPREPAKRLSPAGEPPAPQPSADSVGAEIALLRNLIMQELNVDLIALGPFMNLVYTDDDWYGSFPAKHKNRTAYDLADHQPPQSAIVEDLDRFIENYDVAADPLHFVIAHYCKLFPEFAVCDIGSQYGSSTMSTVLFLRSLQANAKVFSFDPGIAGALAPLNYQNNGFPEITFTKAAVGPVDGYVVLHRELGHSENNRITGALRSRERGSTALPVKCVRLDTFLRANGAFGPTVAKIDTQGAEPGVIGGMSEVLRQHPVAMLLEYTPGAIAKVVKPAKFVEKLLETHYCFDTGVNESHLFEVTSATAQDHQRAVATSQHRWVDLLLVPRNLPNAEAICARIRAATIPGTDMVQGLTSSAETRAPAGNGAAAAPSAEQLESLINDKKTAEAARLLEGVDLAAERGAEFDYYAGVCLGAVGQRERAVELLKRAAAGGFAGVWCAYHLGIFEMRRGEAALASAYFAMSLMLKPELDNVIYPMLQHVAPGIDLNVWRGIEAGTLSAADSGRRGFDRGMALLERGSLGGAAFYFTIALLFDPGLDEARERLLELAPGISLAVMPDREPVDGRATVGYLPRDPTP